MPGCLRTFGLLASGILLLPRLWGLTGVWLAVPLAEGIMFVVSLGVPGEEETSFKRFLSFIIF